jgi:hypothetical protein
VNAFEARRAEHALRKPMIDAVHLHRHNGILQAVPLVYVLYISCPFMVTVHGLGAGLFSNLSRVRNVLVPFAAEGDYPIFALKHENWGRPL